MSIDGSSGSLEGYGFQEPVTPSPLIDTDLRITGQPYEQTATLGYTANAGGDWLQREPSSFINASERPDDTSRYLGAALGRPNVPQQSDTRVVNPESVPITAETYHDIPLAPSEPVERIDKFTVPPSPRRK